MIGGYSRNLWNMTAGGIQPMERIPGGVVYAGTVGVAGDITAGIAGVTVVAGTAGVTVTAGTPGMSVADSLNGSLIE